MLSPRADVVIELSAEIARMRDTIAFLTTQITKREIAINQVMEGMNEPSAIPTDLTEMTVVKKGEDWIWVRKEKDAPEPPADHPRPAQMMREILPSFNGSTWTVPDMVEAIRVKYPSAPVLWPGSRLSSAIHSLVKYNITACPKPILKAVDNGYIAVNGHHEPPAPEPEIPVPAEEPVAEQFCYDRR